MSNPNSRTEALGESIADLDQRIAVVRDNIRELVEQAAGYSGAADDDLAATRLSQQEEELELLIKQRDGLARKKG